MARKHHAFEIPAEQFCIAYFLNEKLFHKNPLAFSPDIAWIQRENFFFYAHATKEESATKNLLQGLFEVQPKLALWILRRRTYTTQKATPESTALFQVAGGKISFDVVPPPLFSQKLHFILPQLTAQISAAQDLTAAAEKARNFAMQNAFISQSSFHKTQKDAATLPENQGLWLQRWKTFFSPAKDRSALLQTWRMLLQLEPLQQVPPQSFAPQNHIQLPQKHLALPVLKSPISSNSKASPPTAKRVFAVLLEPTFNPNGEWSKNETPQIAALAQNFAAENKTLHAEMVLLQGCKTQGLSLTGKEVWVSLQCCRMCAAHLLKAGVGHVYYEEPDLGRFARHTLLQKAGKETYFKHSEISNH